MNIEPYKLYYTFNKEIIIKVVEIDVINSIVYGYDMRTENYVSVSASNLIEANYETIFNYIGFNDYKLCALIANYFISIGISSEILAHKIGISNRTLFRYIKELEK